VDRLAEAKGCIHGGVCGVLAWVVRIGWLLFATGIERNPVDDFVLDR